MIPRLVSLRRLMEEKTAVAAPELTRVEDNGTVRCLACAHRCMIAPEKHGVCHVRFNRDGDLRVPHGYVSSLAVDPIEKKPFYHVIPGARAMSFGMLGCNFHCPFCQNWMTSQTLRDEQAVAEPHLVSPEHVVELALEHRCPILTSTYNEPLITTEWAVEILKLGKRHGLRGAYVSNGYATPEALEYIRPYVEFINVDLKTFEDKTYHKLGAGLENVLEAIRMMKRMEFWIEVITLVVPGMNDSDEELRRTADFLVEVSPDLPWHVTAFHPTYRMVEPPRTPPETLYRAHQIGKTAGLRHVYTGNAPGMPETENTYCPQCGETVIERRGFAVEVDRLEAGACAKCHAKIAGRWE